MKKIFFGVMIGIIMLIAFVLFVFFGGGEYVKKLGKETEKAGGEIVEYEKRLKKSVDQARETAEEVKERFKEQDAP